MDEDPGNDQVVVEAGDTPTPGFVAGTVEEHADGETAIDARLDDLAEGVDTGLLDAIEQELADVERALARLDDGTYGSCEVCGNVLDDAELSRVPAARYCRDHLPLAHA
ncbi:MAG: hypothetical protein ABSG81_10135 [Acidimicrobiales bacterium]